MIGLPEQGSGRPPGPFSIVTTMLRARICGSAITSATFWIAPVGTPAASSAAIQCARGRSSVTASISRLSVLTFSQRAALLAKRGSWSSGPSPSAMQARANSASFPAASTNSPSSAR